MRDQYKVLAEKYEQVQEGLEDYFLRGNARRLVNLLKQDGFKVQSDAINNELSAYKGDVEVDILMDMVSITHTDETGFGPGRTHIIPGFSKKTPEEVNELFTQIQNYAIGAHGASPNSAQYKIKQDIRSRLSK